jgi:putative inorganic carbon (HCO3(-)) transporter
MHSAECTDAFNTDDFLSGSENKANHRDRKKGYVLNTTTTMVAIMLCLPAVVLAAQKSSFLIDYWIATFALNRGVRRFIDYQNGFFDPYSLISLTPLIVGGLATGVVILELLGNPKRFGPKSGRVIRWYLGVCAVAFTIGFVRTKFGAVYDLGNYLGPVGMMGFAVLYSKSRRTMTRWGISAAIVGTIVAVYGLYQFFTIPPWDAFWLEQANMVGYMGYPLPRKMSLFSTMHERGPAAMFLAGTVILILLRPGLLGPFRYPSVAITLLAMLLTYSRTSVIHVVLAMIAFPIVNKGKGLGTIAAIAFLAIFFADPLKSSVPELGTISNRYATLGNIQEDGSFRGRISLMTIALRQSVTNPLGYGLGASGFAAARVSTGQVGVADSTGYLEILNTFGWIGGFFIFRILWQLWQSSSYVFRHDKKDRDVALFRAWFISGMVVLFSGNWLAGMSYFWLLGGYVLSKHDALILQRREAKRRALKEIADENELAIGTV